MRQPGLDAAELGRKRPDTVTLLDAQIGNTNEAYRRVVEGREHRQRWNGVLHLRTVDDVWHARELADELRGPGVGLGKRLHRHTEVDTAAGQRLCGPQVRCRGGVWLDEEVRGAILRRRHPPGGVVDRRDAAAEGFHRRDGEVDIAAR